MRAWALVLLAAGCSGSKDESTGDTSASPEDSATTDTDTDTQTTEVEGSFSVAVRFAIDPDYVPYMDEPPVGRFWGDIFRTSEVSAIGPDAGAVALAGIATDEITLPEDGTPTDVITTISGTGPARITVLGFLDSDANADPGAPEPDDKDPVTLPFDNAFEVVLDAEAPTEITVFFGLLNP